MKRKIFKPNNLLSLLGLLLLAVLLVQCKKEGANAVTVSRALVNTPDSTIFSPFYETNIVPYADTKPDVNDVVVSKSVQTIINNNCVSASCHGGTGVKPYLNDYASVLSMVVPGNPEASQLYQLITTSDFQKAMPPVNYGVDLTVSEKSIIYNWIKNGAKEKPTLVDYRTAAIPLITIGCGSANCHNQATATGAWARKGLLAVTSADTSTYSYINPATGAITLYAQLKEPKLSQVWGAYKDSVRKFYADTLANASFRPYKIFATPVSASSTRGPLNSYDDILLDAVYPKSVRSNSSVVFTSGGKNYYVKGDYLNATSSLLSRIDSTIVLANPRTKVFAANHQGDMAYGDGGLKPSEIAIIRGWYFADPNIPDVWKWGADGTGIFKYRKSGNIVKK